jgi:hypothetical protein
VSDFEELRKHKDVIVGMNDEWLRQNALIAEQKTEIKHLRESIQYHINRKRELKARIAELERELEEERPPRRARAYDNTTGLPCPSRGKTLCTIQDDVHLHQFLYADDAVAFLAKCVAELKQENERLRFRSMEYTAAITNAETLLQENERLRKTERKLIADVNFLGARLAEQEGKR